MTEADFLVERWLFDNPNLDDREIRAECLLALSKIVSKSWARRLRIEAEQLLTVQQAWEI